MAKNESDISIFYSKLEFWEILLEIIIYFVYSFIHLLLSLLLLVVVVLLFFTYSKLLLFHNNIMNISEILNVAGNC